MSVELHLPDLPEVPISLGAAPGRPRPARPWPARLRDGLSSSLPLLLMVALALATWWLVSNSPRPPAAAGERPLSKDPDYTMTTFSFDRFDAEGRLKLRIEGDQLRHYPSTDRIEIDGVRIRAITPDGRETQARAARAIGNGDGSEMQLLGGLRYLKIDTTADWNFTGNVGSLPQFAVSGASTVKSDVWDAVIGAKGVVKLGQGNWFAPYYFDVGTGQSDLTWQAMGGVGYIAAVAASRGFIVASRDRSPYEAAGLKVIDPWKAYGLLRGTCIHRAHLLAHVASEKTSAHLPSLSRPYIP